MQRHSDNKISVSANDKTTDRNIPSDEKGRTSQEEIISGVTGSGSKKNTEQEKQNISGDLVHIRDVNSRDIFKNNVLASQFLRDYSGISFFSDIRPEDIEDETTRFRLQLGIELEGDTVKKIRVRIGDRQEEVYVISLIEHKSGVDADVAMQLLHYMSVIWRDYAKKCNSRRKSANKTTGFRYPLIIPIVYYEGADKWTAGMRLSDRIAHAELAMDCVPDFTYRIVPLRDYDNNNLKAHHNEMSLIMMINKIQGEESYHEFIQTARGYMESIYDSTTGDIQKLILDVIWGLLMKVRVTEEEARDMLNDVRKGKDMGILFENFQTFDWRGKSEELVKEKIRADKAEARADQAEARADQAETRADKAEARAKRLEELLKKEGIIIPDD